MGFDPKERYNRLKALAICTCCGKKSSNARGAALRGMPIQVQAIQEGNGIQTGATEKGHPKVYTGRSQQDGNRTRHIIRPDGHTTGERREQWREEVRRLDDGRSAHTSSIWRCTSPTNITNGRRNCPD